MTTRAKLKFDNKAIEKIKVEDLEFSYVNKDGQDYTYHLMYLKNLS